MVGAPNSGQCEHSLRVSQEWCGRLRIPVASHKTEGPVTRMVFLGIELDTIQISGLDHSELDHLAHHFFLKGLASSTLRAYRSAQRRYGKICAEDGLQAVPASEEGLCRFVARLAGDDLKHRTIKSYLAGVRHLHIEKGLADPFLQPLHRLHYTLRGVKRCEGERGVMTRERLPISPDILKKIKAV